MSSPLVPSLSIRNRFCRMCRNGRALGVLHTYSWGGGEGSNEAEAKIHSVLGWQKIFF